MRDPRSGQCNCSGYLLLLKCKTEYSPEETAKNMAQLKDVVFHRNHVDDFLANIQDNYKDQRQGYNGTEIPV